jgi:glycosyltransferase involved in cell wall biosynthesis
MDILPKTSIIIPCYNEGTRIEVNQYLAYAENNPNVYFLFVNDGSTDNTSELITILRNKNKKQFFSKNLEINCGKAEAVRQGFSEAFKMDFDYIGFFDADLATPLSSINSFCQMLTPENILIVIGSRVRLLGRKIARRAVRHYLGRIFATFSSMILRIPIYDSQCGAKLFKNNSLLRKVFSSPFKVKWIFDVEIFARYKMLTNNIEEHIIEYPLDHWEDIRGSKIKLFDFLVAPFELLKIFWFMNSPSFLNGYAKDFYRDPLDK